MTKSTNKLALFLLLLWSPCGISHPSSPTDTISHKRRAVPEDRKFPRSVFQTFGEEGSAHALSRRGDATFVDIAKAFVVERTGLEETNFEVESILESDVVNFVWFAQKLNGITVANTVATVSVNKLNHIASFASTFVKTPKNCASSTPKKTHDDVLAIAKAELKSDTTEVPALQYFIDESGDAVLTHVVRLRRKDGFLFKAHIDAHIGTVVASERQDADFSYRALPISHQNPTEGFELIVNPEIQAASPQGWVTNATTAGNNVIAYKGDQTGVAMESSPGVFDYTWSASADPTTDPTLAAAKVNAFHAVNMVHDITYLYGFTEQAFNFQQDNFGKGGQGGDRVLVTIQNGGAGNNARFTNTADGVSPEMQLYLWNKTNPFRDSAVSNDVIAHEYTHGVSSRLVNGGRGIQCCAGDDGGPIGEALGDSFADWLSQESAPIQDFAYAGWLEGQGPNGTGARPWKFSTDPAVNPNTYKDRDTLSDMPGGFAPLASLWSNVLHVVLAELVNERGFSADAKTNPGSTGGNAIWMHLFIDHLPIMPQEVSFLMARNAWIQAEANRYSGAHRCPLWKGFSSRGFGFNAKEWWENGGIYENNFDLPEDCVE